MRAELDVAVEVPRVEIEIALQSAAASLCVLELRRRASARMRSVWRSPGSSRTTSSYSRGRAAQRAPSPPVLGLQLVELRQRTRCVSALSRLERDTASRASASASSSFPASRSSRAISARISPAVGRASERGDTPRAPVSVSPEKRACCAEAEVVVGLGPIGAGLAPGASARGQQSSKTARSVVFVSRRDSHTRVARESKMSADGRLPPSRRQRAWPGAASGRLASSPGTRSRIQAFTRFDVAAASASADRR